MAVTINVSRPSHYTCSLSATMAAAMKPSQQRWQVSRPCLSLVKRLSVTILHAPKHITRHALMAVTVVIARNADIVATSARTAMIAVVDIGTVTAAMAVVTK